MVASERILVVDDEPEIADLVELYLNNEGYTVFTCYTAAAALERIATIELDLAILDVMLPGTSGLVICQKIRERYTYPIIMLTAKDAEVDKITGLTIGADDYMTKPFRPLELVARVKAQLRRYKRFAGAAGQGQGQPQGQSQPQDQGQGRPQGHPLGQGQGQGPGQTERVLTHAGLIIDIDSHECFLNEKPLSLTPTEFSILRILCENKGSVVSSDQLFHWIWGDEYFSKSNNTIAVHIRHLREKMSDTSDNPRYIKTVWGVGYKIEK